MDTNEKQMNPLRAIREKCLECAGGVLGEVRNCPIKACALYPFRMGANPYRKKRETGMTEEQRKAFSERMKKARAK